MVDQKLQEIKEYINGCIDYCDERLDANDDAFEIDRLETAKSLLIVLLADIIEIINDEPSPNTFTN